MDVKQKIKDNAERNKDGENKESDNKPERQKLRVEILIIGAHVRAWREYVKSSKKTNCGVHPTATTRL